jgi:hypothetical protein
MTIIWRQRALKIGNQSHRTSGSRWRNCKRDQSSSWTVTHLEEKEEESICRLLKYFDLFAHIVTLVMNQFRCRLWFIFWCWFLVLYGKKFSSLLTIAKRILDFGASKSGKALTNWCSLDCDLHLSGNLLKYDLCYLILVYNVSASVNESASPRSSQHNTGS